MDNLKSEIKKHFDQLQDRFVVFHNFGVQVEGWFKGEMLTILNRMQNDGITQNLDREIKVDNGKIDLMFN